MPDPRELAEAIRAAASVCSVAPSAMRPAKLRPKKPPGTTVHPQNPDTRALISAYQQARWAAMPADAPERLARAERARALQQTYWAAHPPGTRTPRVVSADTRDRLSRVQEARWAAFRAK